MFEVLVNLNEPISHHLNDASFLAMQENTSNVPCDDIVDMFVKHCADEYSMGVSEINVNESVDSLLQLCATSYAIVQTMQQTGVNCLLRVLFDSGSDKTLLKQSALPPGINPSLGKKRKVIGVAASSIMDREVLIENMTLPEFLSTQRVSGPIRAFVMNNNESQYDLIIGMDVMQILGIDIHNSTKTIVWDTLRVPFKPEDYFKGAFPHSLIDAMMGSPDPADTDGYKSKTIKSSSYEQHDPHVVAQQQKHLTPSQRQDLAVLLSNYPKLFSGKLGRYPHRKVHLELRKDAQPARCRPHPVPKHHQKVFKEELDHLCTLGVLSRCSASEWLTPSFIIPKKDGRVHWISDFWELNKHIKCKVYNLPKIQDILSRRSGYAFFSKLDISMQYYTFELDDASKDLCTICTPFGNYRYNRLPMGVSQSPDIAQEIMEEVFQHLRDEVEVSIDNIGVFSNDWQSHCVALAKVLDLLNQNNFTVNPSKCEWAFRKPIG
jgi:Reverse transcriptase (RNA-dependent DNA polymerase)